MKIVGGFKNVTFGALVIFFGVILSILSFFGTLISPFSQKLDKFAKGKYFGLADFKDLADNFEDAFRVSVRTFSWPGNNNGAIEAFIFRQVIKNLSKMYMSYTN